MIDLLGRPDLDEATELLAAACRFDAAASVAAEKLFGPAPAPHASIVLGARISGRLVGLAVLSGRWLRLLCVHPDERRRGIAQSLLNEVEARARASHQAQLRTGDQPGNYLAPGIDLRNEETIVFLARRGYREVARYENLAVPLVDNPRVSLERSRALAETARRRGYQIRRAEPDDTVALLAFASNAFAPAWAFEVARALETDPPGVHIAIHVATGVIVAFACHDGNNRGLGWFGPAGTAPEHRGQGLGQALLIPCLVDVAAAGRTEGVIAWIGPRAFYESVAGATSGRSFVVLAKQLEKVPS